MDERLLTKSEVADRCQKTTRTVENWMDQGLLPYYKVGGSVLFKWDDVLAHLDRTCRVVRSNGK